MPDTFPPFILLDGIVADWKLLEPQQKAFANIRVPAWLDPTPRESLASFARRMAAAVDPGGPCFIGGLSFGGMIALEMMRHLPVLGCFLISSCRSPESLAGPLLAAEMTMAGMPLMEQAMRLSGFGFLTPFFTPPSNSFLRMTTGIDPDFARWASRAVLAWRPKEVGPDAPPIFQIHGDADPVLPHDQVRTDIVVPGGGHFLTITHPHIVNAFLRKGMRSALRRPK